MNAIIFRLTQIVCVAVIFGNIDCDQMTLQRSGNDEMLNQTIGCMAVCMRDTSDFGLNGCYQECMNSSTSLLPSVVETNSNETFRLLCRDADAIAIEVKSNNKLDDRELIVVEIVENGEPMTVISDSAHVRLENLKLNTTYKVSVSIFNAMKQYRRLPDVKQMSTLSSRTYQPLAIPKDSMRIVDFAVDEDPHAIDAYIEWSPADDMVCSYEVMLYETVENTQNSEHTFQRFMIDESEQLYRYPVSHLVMDSEYHLSIGGLNTYVEQIEGLKSEINFATPTCWEMHNFNMSLCPPQLLVNLTSKQELVANNVYNINVTWNWIRPEHRPIHYIVSIYPHYLDLNDTVDNTMITMNVTGDECSAYFHNISVASATYDIQVRAYTNGGSTVTHATQSFKEIYDNSLGNQGQSKEGNRMHWIVLSLLLLLLVALIVLAALYFRVRFKRNIVKHSDDIYLRKLLTGFNKDKMEVKRDQIELFEEIGEGAFGTVRRGKLMPSGIDVAVKMVKSGKSPDSPREIDSISCSDGDGVTREQQEREKRRTGVKELLREIQLMKSVSRHENIVGIVGHYTTDTDYTQLMLLTEYCSRGSLLNCLRASHPDASGHDIKSSTMVKTPDNVFQNNIPRNEEEYPEMLANNKGYDLPTENNNVRFDFAENRAYGLIDPNGEREQDEKLKSGDLMNIARQIAAGMEFLAKNKIVHRDLAARNVLVSANKTAKIADFGLSRDVYVKNYYDMSTSKGTLLPVKWMALESIVQQRSTTESDVWMYGILLYEIVTLGCTPYPSVEDRKLVGFLEEGQRMAKPKRCSDELYVLMRKCWLQNWNERPSFTAITQTLDELIANIPSNQLIGIDDPIEPVQRKIQSN